MVTEVPRQRASCDATVVGRAVYAAFHVSEGHVSETIADVQRARNGTNVHVSVVVVDGQIAADVFRVHVAERSCDIGRGSAIECNRSVASRDGRAALDVAHGDAAKAVLHVESAFHVRDLHGAVLIVDDGCCPRPQ